MRKICAEFALRPDAIHGRGRTHAVAAARGALAYLWMECLGRSSLSLAAALDLDPVSIRRAARRGRQH